MTKIYSFFKSILPFLLILVFCAWAIKPLFTSGFFTMHDDEQIARLYEMVTVLGQGQLPPRWVPDLGFGYGYPLFNFYPPFVYYLGALIHLLGFSLINATKIVIGLGFFLSGIFMYLWTKNRFGILAGLFAAVLYIYAPYHSVDIYVRGALSEFFSFVFIPAVFWSLDRLAKKQNISSLLISSLLLCFVILTHTLVMLQFVPILVAYLLFLLWEERKSFKKIIPYFTAFGLLGIGLSAYFAFPSLLEKQYTLVDNILITQLANYTIHFVCPSQLWNSLWGYGGSASGCLDGLSFQVGKVQIIVSVLAIIFSLLSLFMKKKKTSITLFIFTLFLFSLFITTNYSKFIWDHLSFWWYIQFPWRFLLFAAVFSSFLGGYVIFTFQKIFNTKIALGVIIILSVLALYEIRNDFRPQTYLPVGDNYYLANEDIQWRVSRLSYEYVPKEVATRLSSLKTTELAIDKKDIPKQPFAIISGNMHITVDKNLAANKRMEITVTKPGLLQLNTYAFPGWEVMLNNEKIGYNTNNKLHLIQIPLARGNYILEANFQDTTVRFISNIITILSLISVVILFLLSKVLRR